MFSRTDSAGTRLKDWNTNPTRVRRRRVRPASRRRVTSVAPIVTVPASGVSRPARQCMSVDLPLPEGPITAVQRPLSMATSTPSSARTVTRPWE